MVVFAYLTVSCYNVGVFKQIKEKITTTENRKLVILFAFMVIGISLMMAPAWINGEFFLGGGDIKTQWDPFYYLNRKETISALKNRQLPFYSWILFLGTNLWASKASYGFFDIYNLLAYPFHADYLHVYMFLCYLKMLAGAFFCYKFFKYIGAKEENCLLGALCFGLSSYGVYFTSEFGFLSFYSLLPLYFLGIEKYLKEKRKKLFIISVATLFLTNYYLFFSVSLLTPFYFIYRFYNFNGSLKGLVKSALMLIGYYLIGFLISGAVIVPVFFYITQNDRVGAGGFAFAYDSVKLYLHLLSASFLPNHTYIYGNNIFDFGSHNLKEICFFSSSCVTLLIPQVLKGESSHFRKSTLILYLVVMLFVFIPGLSSLLNGFSEPSFRFSMVCIFLNIFVFVSILDGGCQTDKKILLVTFILEAALMFGCFFLSLALENQALSSYKEQFLWISIACVFMIAYCFILLKEKRTLLKYVLLVELCVYSLNFGYRTKGVDLASYENARSVLGDYESFGMAKGYLDGFDQSNYQSFYRVYVPYDSLYWTASRNMNLYYGIPGVMTYDSTYEPSFNELKRIGNIPTVQMIDWEFSIQDPDLLNFLNVKYAFAINEEEIPFKNFRIIQENYRGGILIAENMDYVSLGRTYPNFIQKESYNNDPKALTKAIISNDPEVKEIVSNSNEPTREMYGIYYYNNHLEGFIDCEEDNIMLMTIPYDRGWKAIVNGEEVKTFNINCGFIGIPVSKGTNRIDMYFVPQGFKVGACMSGIGILAFIAIVLAENMKIKRKKTASTD